MESHPEEDDYSKHQHQCSNAFLGLSGSKLFDSRIVVLCLFDRLHRVGKPTLTCKIYNTAHNQRYTGNTEAKTIAAIEGLQIVRVNVSSIIYKAFAGKILIGNPLGHGGGKHSTDVDGHVKQRKGIVATVSILWFIIEIAYHDLQISLEQSCTE